MLAKILLLIKFKLSLECLFRTVLILTGTGSSGNDLELRWKRSIYNGSLVYFTGKDRSFPWLPWSANWQYGTEAVIYRQCMCGRPCDKSIHWIEHKLAEAQASIEPHKTFRTYEAEGQKARKPRNGILPRKSLWIWPLMRSQYSCHHVHISPRVHYLNLLASRSLSNNTRISFSLTGPYKFNHSFFQRLVKYLYIANNGTRLILNEFDSDLGDSASWSRSAEDFCYFCKFNGLCVHFLRKRSWNQLLKLVCSKGKLKVGRALQKSNVTLPYPK